MLLDVHTSPVMEVGEWAADSRRYSKVESSHGKEIPSCEHKECHANRAPREKY